MIQELVEAYYSRPQERYKGSGRISCSSFGRCIRSVMLGLSGVEAGEFPAHVREVMDLGVAYEDVTAKILKSELGGVVQQPRLGNDIWSGKLDFLITSPDERPVIVEHKATGDKHFDFSGCLPRYEHWCQAWLYGQLYQERHRVKPRIILFYRTWGSFAEFELLEGEGRGYAEGRVGATCVRRPIALETLPKRRAEFEAAYHALPAIPEVPCSSPCDAFGCTFRGAPSCGYYKECWT